jgi:hypothetical protein
MGRRRKTEPEPEEEELEDLVDAEDLADPVESEESEAATDGAAEEEESATEEAGEGEFGEAIGDDVLDEYDEADVDLKVVDEVLSHKDQNARALAIRRAIEERLEAKRLSRDLDYLDLDPED